MCFGQSQNAYACAHMHMSSKRIWSITYMSVRIHQTSDLIKSDPNTSTRTAKSELIKSDFVPIRIYVFGSDLINLDWAVQIYRLDRLNVHNRSILSYIVDCHSIVTGVSPLTAACSPPICRQLIPQTIPQTISQKRESINHQSCLTFQHLLLLWATMRLTGNAIASMNCLTSIWLAKVIPSSRWQKLITIREWLSSRCSTVGAPVWRNWERRILEHMIGWRGMTLLYLALVRSWYLKLMQAFHWTSADKFYTVGIFSKPSKQFTPALMGMDA